MGQLIKFRNPSYKLDKSNLWVEANFKDVSCCGSMIRRHALLMMFCLGACIPWAELSANSEGGLFNTVRVDGKNYINLSDFCRYYGFDSMKRSDLDLVLTGRFKKLQLRINGRGGVFNGVRIWLNDAPLESRNSILLSDVDVRKSLDPILRAWSVPRRSVQKIILDPGHGGEDRGASGYRGSLEKRLSLDMAARVEKLLRKAGFNTLMTRRRDTYVSLEDRSEMANASDADIFISLHFNSAKPNKQPHGIETYCLTPVGLGSTGSIRRRLGMGEFGEEAGNRFDAHNMLLAYCVQQQILKRLPDTEDRGVKRARFFVIKATKRPSILIENGFLSNPAEEKKILQVAYRDKLAAAIVEGVKRYASIMNVRSDSR